jgi:hypothetical protein
LQRPARVARDFRVVSDDDQGDTFFTVQLLKNRHDLEAHPRIERSSGLISEDDPGIVDERPRNGHALLLSS